MSVKSDRPSWNTYFKQLTELTATRSCCNRLHVGCVLVKDRRIIATGYNGFISGAPHKSIVVNNHEQSTVHAEQNCIADCSKRGTNTNGATAYITHFPCINCCKILLAAGINEIVYESDYHNDPIVKELLDESNCKIIQIT